MRKKKIGKIIVVASLSLGFLGYFPYTYAELSKTTNPEKPLEFSQQVLAVGDTVGAISIFFLVFGLFIFFREEK